MREQLVAQQHEAATPVKLLTADILLNRKSGMPIVVLGWHGWTALKRLLSGSVAAAVMHAAPCSFELVRFRPQRCESEACRLADRGAS